MHRLSDLSYRLAAVHGSPASSWWLHTMMLASGRLTMLRRALLGSSLGSSPSAARSPLSSLLAFDSSAFAAEHQWKPLVAYVHETARELLDGGAHAWRLAERRSIVTAFCMVKGL